MTAPAHAPGAGERLHALDACRASAMLLGLYLHAALPHRPGAGLAWAFQDVSTSGWMAASVEVIHAFRMQLFFLLAGFFTALLIERRGWRGMATNRGMRIGVPYIIGVVVISPSCAAAWMWAAGEGGLITWRVLVGEIGGSWHLWFLRELLVFCVAAIVVSVVAPRRLLHRLAAVVGRVGLHPLGPLALAGLVAVTVLAQPWWGIYEPGVLPRWENLVHYGLFFAVGAAMWPARAQLSVLGRRWVVWLAVGALAAAAHLLVRAHLMERGGYDLQWIGAEPAGAALAARAAYATMSAALVAAFLGFFVRVFARPSAVWRYVSDASYWVYLMHFPLVVMAGALLADWRAPAEVKVLLVLVVVSAVLLGSYQVMVRHTVIGRVLNGPRRGA